MHPFEQVLSVCAEDIEFELRGCTSVVWADFLLNPRRLRGSDFLMRWSQGLWSEERLVQAVNTTGRYFAMPYGPSGTAPEEVREFELYFERLENAGLGKLKRPDLLIFHKADQPEVEQIVIELGGLAELPFTPETNSLMEQLLTKAVIAVECENSLWVAKQMPDYNTPLKAQKRLGGQLGLRKNAVLPTVIVKDEDRAFLMRWQTERGVPIHIWHAFYDLAFGLSLNKAESLITEGLIEPTIQTFQAPGGATSKKAIYKFYYHYAYPLGETQGEVTLLPSKIIDANGHILPYVRFQGGTIELSDSAISQLNGEAQRERSALQTANVNNLSSKKVSAGVQAATIYSIRSGECGKTE